MLTTPPPESTTPLVSVIIPAFNAEKTIARALDSVFVTAYPHCEVIVIDDGSTDNTVKVVSDYPVTVVLQENGGPAAARNRGVNKSSGEFIAFVDADDHWAPNKLTIEVEYLIDHPDVDVVYGRVKYEWEDGSEGYESRIPQERPLVDHFILGSGTYRSTVFERVGMFAPQLRYSEDLDWYLRLLEADINIVRLEHISLHYRLSKQNSTYGKDLTQLNVLQVLKRSLDRRRATTAPDQ